MEDLSIAMQNDLQPEEMEQWVRLDELVEFIGSQCRIHDFQRSKVERESWI